VACTDGRGVLYAEDVPDDVAIIPARPVADTVSPDFDLGVPCEDDLMLPVPRAARLRSIPASADTATALEDEQPLVSRRRSRPRLRVVK
jgi:hypothetical protein